MTLHGPRRGRGWSTLARIFGVTAVVAGCLLVPLAASGGTAGATSTGLASGSIQHVWLIILENKSFDETFTGLNNNTYLWQTLPSEGVELTHYYGTGHSSMDNYISLVSGQAPEEDTQEDCSDVNVPMGSNTSITTTGSVGADTPNWNYGQVSSLLNPSQPSGANAPLGSGSVTTNGCTYPTDAATLFDQFNLAGVSWKGYAQDLGGAQPIGSTSFVNDSVPGRDDGPCGAPGSSTENPVSNPTYLTAVTGHPLPSDVSSYTSASLVAGTGTANDPQYSDQYVAKHFPFPWFESLIGGYNTTTGASQPALTEPTGGTNCDSNHIANLDSPTNGLVQDLQNNTVPNFSWITPDNCSDAHDTSCKGNNLSGAFGTNPNGTVNLSDPIYRPAGLPAFDPEATTPINYTGGLYAADLFLAYYVPLIEDSAAYSHGLIDITFDEGEPSFTYSGNSFNNVLTTGTTGMGPGTGSTCSLSNGSNGCTPNESLTFGSGGAEPGADSVYGADGIAADAAGETINGVTVHDEPYGPNSTLGTNSNGDQLYPGPGNNSFIDRPPACGTAANCVSGLVKGGGGTTSGATTDSSATGSSSSSEITDPSIVADETGRGVTGTNIPTGSFVGAVTNTGPLFPTSSGGTTVTGSFQLVDDAGNPVDPTGTVSGITLSAECAPATGGLPSTCTTGQTIDPLYDATDPTPGGGDTGSVLISPYITPGTTDATYYNHYSWLRTMEDLFNVSSCAGTSTDVTLPAGTVCGGLDGQGHLGYAAQVGLDGFGSDVFSAPGGNGWLGTQPPNALPETPLAFALPAAGGIVLLGGFLFSRRRKARTTH